MMEEETPSVGPMETNPLKEDEPTEPSQVLKIGKNLESELADQLVSFLKNNIDVLPRHMLI